MPIKTLLDFLPDGETKELTIEEAERIAEQKYKDDSNIRTWLKIYRHGTSDIKTKQGKIKGIPPYSDFAKKHLIRAIQIREEGKVRQKPL